MYTYAYGFVDVYAHGCVCAYVHAYVCAYVQIENILNPIFASISWCIKTQA